MLIMSNTAVRKKKPTPSPATQHSKALRAFYFSTHTCSWQASETCSSATVQACALEGVLSALSEVPNIVLL